MLRVSPREASAIGVALSAVALLCVLSRAAPGGNDGACHRAARSLVEQSLRWTAQDHDKARATLASLRDAVYASAYLSSARMMLKDAELSRATGMDVHELAAQTDAHLDSVTKRVAKEMRLRRSAVHVRDSWIAES